MLGYAYTCVDTRTHAYMQTHGALAKIYPEILIFYFFTTATRMVYRRNNAKTDFDQMLMDLVLSRDCII